MRRAVRKISICGLMALLIAACATAESVDGETGGEPSTGGDSGEAGENSGGASGSSGGGTGGLGGAGGAATGGSSGIGGSSGSGGASCGNPNSCANAFDLGTLSGDEGGFVSHGNSGSLFVKLRVTEDNHSPIGEALEAKLSLTVPAAADLDLYAYLNPDDPNASPCGSAPYASAASGGTGKNEQLTLSWGDGLTGSGNDDSRTVVIEIAHKSGSCDGWTLAIQGDP